MMRLAAAFLISILVLGLGLPGAKTGWAADLPPTLRDSAVVDGDVIRLGDLWDNLGPRANVVVSASPQPGKRITADARWLQAVAQNNGVDWRPASAFDRIVISRAGQMVDPAMIEGELHDSLVSEGVPAPFEVELTNRSTFNITVPTNDATAEIGVRDLVWDQRNGRFAATVEIPAGSPNALRQRVTGRVYSMIRVPVLSHLMSKGDVIQHSDIDWLDVRSETVRRDAITDPRQLIGQEPKATLRPGTPIRTAELQRPILVQRNSMVSIILKTPYMNLTTQGKALEDGGQGDIIRVTNLQSKRTIEATVDGPGTVSVSSNTPRALAN